ncbi:zf-HC2 domain-containing protein, partial [Roseisolibacter sp. H3M3-2]|uniref:anti-sigma factor family protein n=1 Tax=Roseisolibacter sp. H3M3-2 TaxID=3031323 RepID=UPI0023DB419D
MRPLSWSPAAVGCPVPEAQAHQLLDGELPPLADAALREHLTRCPPCAARVERLERLLAALGQQPTFAPRASARLRRQ